MSGDLISILGLDPEDLEWHDLAMCQGMDSNDFFENYESSLGTARVTDQVCLSCPVLKQCIRAGMENGEYGVWGGIYLTAGKPDNNRNSHKTKETWKELQDRIADV